MTRNPSDNKAWQRMNGGSSQDWAQKWADYEERNKGSKAQPRGSVFDATSSNGILIPIGDEGDVLVAAETWTRESDRLYGKEKHLSDSCDAWSMLET